MTSPAEQRSDILLGNALLREVLVQTASLPGADLRVLLYYMTAAPLGETVRETAKDVAIALNLHKGSLSKSIKRLRDQGWLQLSYRVGGVAFYGVGPRITQSMPASPEAEDGQALAEVVPFPTRFAEDEE